MNFATGVDIELIERFEKISYEEKRAFYDRVFTQQEQEYCIKKAKPSQHFAVRFCAKEAVIKALGEFGEIVDAREIEIIKSEINVPKVVIHNKRIKELFPKLKVKISLAHAGGNAIASAFLYNEGCRVKEGVRNE